MVLKATALGRIQAREWGVFQRDGPLVTVAVSLVFGLQVFSLYKVRSKLRCAQSSERCNREAPSLHSAGSLVLHRLHKNNTNTGKEEKAIVQQ